VTRELCAAGDEVAILGRRPEALAAVAASTGALDVVCDVSDAGQVAGAIAVVVERFGQLDGLVLNAGVMVPGGISELSLDDWDALVSVNLTGAFYVARCALPALLHREGRSSRWRQWPRCGLRPRWAGTR
jgi:NADP-dependent 3-hydroxy acid dehydrogenase YdfG